MSEPTTTVEIVRSDEGTALLLNGRHIAGSLPGRDGATMGVIWAGIPVRRILDALPHQADDGRHDGHPMRVEQFAGWLASGERGLSSEAIVQRLTGVKIHTGRSEGAVEPPHDPSDFRRCARLLDMVTEARKHLHLMRDVSPAWARIIDRWDELEHLLNLEESRGDGKAPQLYRRIKTLNEGE